MQTKTKSESERQPTIEELNSSVFHHNQKNCSFSRGFSYERGKRSRNYGKHPFNNRQENRAIRKFCLTHNILVCHCGFEIGWHFSESSKSLNKFKKHR